MGVGTAEQRADALRWYHTIELPGEVTRGFVDTRRAAARVPIPTSLEGKRCLDVGTQNGFWAFEMERRGAREVVGIDLDDAEQLDWPPRAAIVDPDRSYLKTDDRERSKRAFEYAKGALGSSVERRSLNVYDLSPESVGQFDFAFVGSLLLHVRDPVLALAAVRGVCSGEAVVFEAIDLPGSIGPRRKPRALLDGSRVWWWTPNLRGLIRIAESAGFDLLDRTRMMLIPPGEGFRDVSLGMLLRAGPFGALALKTGFPHVALKLRVTQRTTD